MTDLEKQIYVAKQIHKAVQMTIQSVDLDDAEAMEVADVYPGWETDKTYKEGAVVKYGTNADGETQLYRVVQEHVSQADWTPDKAPSLYKAIGIADDGIGVWTQPYGATDAYQTGDRVHYPDADGDIYESIVDNNVWAPDVYGWEKV